MSKIRLYAEYLLSIIFLFFLTRQVPFMKFVILMNISLFCLFLINAHLIAKRIYALPDPVKILLVVVEFLIVANAICSLFVAGNSPSLVLRFFIILQFIIFAYFVRLDKKFLDLFQFFCIIQSLFLIVFYVVLVTKFNSHTYLPIRFYFISRGWGDVITHNGYYYRIIVNGNELIPIAFYLSCILPPRRFKLIIQIIFLLGILIAGNFSYLIATAFFLLFYFFIYSRDSKDLLKRTFFLIVLFWVSIIPLFYFIRATLEKKQGESLGTRVDQANVLWNNLVQNKINLLWGTGLGNTVSAITLYRNYTGNYYYELQVLYVFNQLGLIFLVFLFFNIVMSAYNYHSFKTGVILYISYLIFAVTNPYILNTTQVVVILILNTLTFENTEIKTRQSFDPL
jgi:hypothetical protein